MKLLKIATILLVFFSCSSDDDDNSNFTSVIGSWKLTTLNTEMSYDLNGDDFPSVSLLNESGCYQNETIIFNSDGTGTFNYNSFAEVYGALVSGTIDEYEFFVDCVQESTTSSINWTQNGNQITITDSEDETINVGIFNSQMIIVRDNGFEVNSVGGNSGILFMEDLRFIYTKQ